MIPENSLTVKIKSNAKCSICTCGKSKSMPYCDNEHRQYNKKNSSNYKSLKVWSKEDCEITIFSNMWNDNE
jgi:CDGSH-type Zn-finger protein